MNEGQPVKLLEDCRRCGKKRPMGIEYVWEEQVYFKCDSCGREMHMGVTEELNRIQLEDKLGNEKAKANRDRYDRELEASIQKKFKNSEEGFEAPPDIIEEYATLFEAPDFDERDKSFATTKGYE